jgi:hypothetical protein
LFQNIECSGPSRRIHQLHRGGRLPHVDLRRKNEYN